MRSGSRSQAESQFNIQTTEKESNMTSGRLMKHLFLPLLGFGAIAAATAASPQTAPPAFVSAIGDNTNVVFVENHIVIDRPANEIFDFVSTPGNVYKWLTKASSKFFGLDGGSNWHSQR